MLSRTWTVDKFFNHVAAQVPRVSDLAMAQRFELINRVQSSVLAPFYQFVSHLYMTPVILQADDGGKYAKVNMMNPEWDATNQTLTALMNISFAADDVGKMIVMQRETSVWTGIISSYLSHSEVVLTGSDLPTSNVSPEAVIMANNSVADDYVSLAPLNIMHWGGSQVKMELFSTATPQTRPISLTEIRAWNVNSIAHRSMIVWCYSGDTLLLRRSADLTSYGILVLRYPRVPNNVSSGLHYIDLPDGPIIYVAQSLLKRHLLRISGTDDKSTDNELLLATDAVFKAFGVNVRNEELEQKVKALV